MKSKNSLSLIPRLKPWLGYREMLAALIPGNNDITSFEKEFAQKFSCNHGIMFPYGRSGMYSLFKTWNLDNSEIICPAYTCVVVPHSIVISGNKPVFVDCGENSFNMCYEKLADSFTHQTRAVIVTHIFGYPMDTKQVKDIVSSAEKRFRNRIYIIQDAAHSFACKSGNKPVTSYEDASVFGLNISKLITSIFGGMVTTNCNETAEKLRNFRASKFISDPAKSLKRLAYLAAVYPAFSLPFYWMVNRFEKAGFLDRFVRYYDEAEIDFPKDWNTLPVPLEARVGSIQLKKYESIIKERCRLAKSIISHFNNSSYKISFLPFDPDCTYSHLVGLTDSRDQVIKDFYETGIQLGSLIEYSIPYMKAYKKYAKDADFPVSKYYSEHTINIPIWKGMKKHMEKILNAV